MSPTFPPPHIDTPHAYPVCCGMRTSLGAFGWRCLQCGHTHPFLDAEGKRWDGKIIVTLQLNDTGLDMVRRGELTAGDILDVRLVEKE